MAKSIPGTTLIKTEETQEVTLDFLIPLLNTSMLNVTGGLMLSQVCGLTGLEPATIQNWVKRGFVSSPVAKKYSKEQTARILIINSLRDTIQLDKIAMLLSYLNGDLLDSSDDIITDSELYIHFCKITFQLTAVETTKREVIIHKIKETLKDYQSIEKPKLEKALLVMVLMYQATLIKRKADSVLEEIDEEIVNEIKEKIEEINIE